MAGSEATVENAENVCPTYNINLQVIVVVQKAFLVQQFDHGTLCKEYPLLW